MTVVIAISAFNHIGVSPGFPLLHLTIVATALSFVEVMRTLIGCIIEMRSASSYFIENIK